MPNSTLAIDRVIKLDVNGSDQQVRVCAARGGFPPLLVVQGGPGLPLLHEVKKFQRRLNLERDFLVCYWEQRGCGGAPRKDALSASWSSQVDDLRTVLRWLCSQAKQRVVVLGISMGATIALLGTEHEGECVEAMIAVSPDARTSDSDAAASAFLRQQGIRNGGRRLNRRLLRLGDPPYVDSAAFQRRARLLADLGTIEHGRSFRELAWEMLFGMLAAYGAAGTLRALRNFSLVQRMLLPEIASLDLFADPPHVQFPVHYVFGERDALNPSSIVERLPAAIAAPVSTVVRVPDAGHMVHFDRPDVVRSIVGNARDDRGHRRHPDRA